MELLSVNKFYWKKGGSESVFFNEKNMLEKHGHQVIPFSMKSIKNEKTPYSKYFVDEVDYDKPGLVNRFTTASKIIYSFDARAKMKSLLQENSPELAHFHIFQHQISPSVFGPLKECGVPIILTLHDLKPICPSYKNYVGGKVCEACIGGKFYNCFKNKCTKGSSLGSLVNTIEMYFHSVVGYYKNVDRYIAVSHFYKKKMIEAGFSEKQINYLPNYIDADKYDPSQDDVGYILYFGRLSEEKGLSVLLDAASIQENLIFKIVGTGPLEDELKQIVNQKGLSNVQLMGFKSGDELKSILQQATAVVVPSEWYENCPMTILEAFAAGRPVIGANIGGIPELIEEGVDGFVFESGNVAALTEKLQWIYDNRSKARDMGLVGRKKVEEKFNAEVHYDGLMSIYNSVLGSDP